MTRRFTTTLRALLGSVCLAGALAACGGGQSPGDVVKAAFAAADRGEYEEAISSMDVRSREEIERQGADARVRAAWDELTRRGALDSVEIVEERIHENGLTATVRYRLHFIAGSTPVGEDDDGSNPRAFVARLVKEDGAWRLADAVEQGHHAGPASPALEAGWRVDLRQETLSTVGPTKRAAGRTRRTVRESWYG